MLSRTIQAILRRIRGTAAGSAHLTLNDSRGQGRVAHGRSLNLVS
jgi:hypothetical protein